MTLVFCLLIEGFGLSGGDHRVLLHLLATIAVQLYLFSRVQASLGLDREKAVVRFPVIVDTGGYQTVGSASGTLTLHLRQCLVEKAGQSQQKTRHL